MPGVDRDHPEWTLIWPLLTEEMGWTFKNGKLLLCVVVVVVVLLCCCVVVLWCCCIVVLLRVVYVVVVTTTGVYSCCSRTHFFLHTLVSTQALVWIPTITSKPARTDDGARKESTTLPVPMR